MQLIAWTNFQAPADVPWDTDADGAQPLAEFAGRPCYLGHSKPDRLSSRWRPLSS